MKRGVPKFLLTDRQLEVLDSLDVYCGDSRRRQWIAGWARPMDIGARDGSAHTAILGKLVKLKLVERMRRNTLANDLASGRPTSNRGHRGSYRYRITRIGRYELFAEACHEGDDEGDRA